MIVAKITEAKAKEIENTIYTNGKYFNVIEDNKGNYVISLKEAQFVDNYTEIEYIPKEIINLNI